MNPPFYTADGGDLMIFETEDIMKSYLEPVDVEGSQNWAFDSEGRCLKLVVKKWPISTKFLWLFPIRSIVEEIFVEECGDKADPDALKKLIVNYLSSPSMPLAHRESREVLELAPLPELVLKSLKFIRVGDEPSKRGKNAKCQP